MNYPWTKQRSKPEVYHSPRQEKAQGNTSSTYQWTDKQPHPANMLKYDSLNRDAEVSIALDLLSDIVAGVGFHTEMPEDKTKPAKERFSNNHRNLKIVNEAAEKFNYDEKFQEISYTTLAKGFCPIELLGDGDFKFLPPETFYVWKTIKGEVYKYTQQTSSISDSNAIVWEGAELDNIVVFTNGYGTYGKALVDCIASETEDLQSIRKDMVKIFRRYSSPHRRWEYDNSIATIKDEAVKLEPNEDLFLGNIPLEALRVTQDELDPNARFMEYVDTLYLQKAEGLHAPLLLYLKNATEASATVMMESVDRFVNGKQRYLKRRIEKYLFEPLTGNPVPRLIWGVQNTGLEDIKLADVGTLFSQGAIKFNQAQEILKNLLPTLPEPIEEPQPQQQQKGNPQLLPNQKQPYNPIDQPSQKMQELHKSLKVLEDNYRADKLSIVEAINEAERTIEVYVQLDRAEKIEALSKHLQHPIKRFSSDTESYYQILRNELLQSFKEVLSGNVSNVQPRYTVIRTN